MKNWKAILGVVAIFLLGALAGGLVVGGVVARRIHRYRTGQPVFSADEVTHFLQRQLDLDAAQQSQVRLIVAETQTEMQAAQRATEAILSAAVVRMQPVLRAEQREKLDRLVAERRAHRLER
ncbi:MAG: hypothetical protein WCS70_14210 [Verrucomicrobiota bacterium]